MENISEKQYNVGDVFTTNLNGEDVELLVEIGGCGNCVFYHIRCTHTPECRGDLRDDGYTVHFVFNK